MGEWKGSGLTRIQPMANDRVKSRTTRDEGTFPCSCHTGDKKEAIRRSWFRETYEGSEGLGLFD